MARYRRLAEMDAVQWTGENEDEIRQFVGERGQIRWGKRIEVVSRHPVGTMSAHPGNWIVKGEQGDLMVYTAEDFAAAFTAV